MLAAAAGMSVCGDSGEGGRDGPRERLGRVAADPWALTRVGEGDDMMTVEE